MTEEYESMTVAELKDLLREQNLPVSGNKKELIARLQESSSADEEEEVEEESVEEEDDFDDFDEDDDFDFEDL